jgi:hypothetical protein
LSCLERRYLIDFINEKHEATKEAIEAAKAKASSKKSR